MAAVVYSGGWTRICPYPVSLRRDASCRGPRSLGPGMKAGMRTHRTCTASTRRTISSCVTHSPVHPRPHAPMLHHEILHFTQDVLPRKEEHLVRLALLARLRRHLRASLSGVGSLQAMLPFGSMASGIILPSRHA